MKQKFAIREVTAISRNNGRVKFELSLNCDQVVDGAMSSKKHNTVTIPRPDVMKETRTEFCMSSSVSERPLLI